MGLLRLFAVFDTKGLVIHENAQDLYTLPPFYSGESPLTQFLGLQRNSAGTAGRDPWAQVDPGSYGLKVGLFWNSDNSLLAFQDTWPADAGAYSRTARLIYDSAKVDLALTGQPSGASCTLEMEITPGAGGAFKIQAAATLKKGLITPIAVSTAPPEVGATQAWVQQVCMPRDGASDPNNPCDGFFIKSRPSGRTIFIYWDDNGNQQRELL
jgi:hypothetical protein